MKLSRDFGKSTDCHERCLQKTRLINSIEGTVRNQTFGFLGKEQFCEFQAFFEFRVSLKVTIGELERVSFRIARMFDLFMMMMMFLNQNSRHAFQSSLVSVSVCVKCVYQNG